MISNEMYAILLVTIVNALTLRNIMFNFLSYTAFLLIDVQFFLLFKRILTVNTDEGIFAS